MDISRDKMLKCCWETKSRAIIDIETHAQVCEAFQF